MYRHLFHGLTHAQPPASKARVSSKGPPAWPKRHVSQANLRQRQRWERSGGQRWSVVRALELFLRHGEPGRGEIL